MKYLFLIALLTFAALSGKSQNYILLDRKWKEAGTITDSVNKEDISKGKFPIFLQDLDSLIIITSKFKNLKDDGLNRTYYNSEDFKAGHFSYEIDNIRRTYGDSYEIDLITAGPFGKYKLQLSDPRLLLPQNQKLIRSFLKYLNLTKSKINSKTK